jgi:RNA-dependent RNA polymerase
VAALQKDEFAGLGFSTDNPEWFGGKVEFRGQLQDGGPSNPYAYKVVLEKPQIGASCRFTRRFGSMSFLRVKVPDMFLNRPNNRLTDFFSRPFILNGRVFQTFYAKDDNMFLFRTNEIFKGGSIQAPGSSSQARGFSFQEFLDWHNPLELNTNQASSILGRYAHWCLC